MNMITREEMVKMAVETRKNVTSAIVTPEELDEYPVEMEQLHIPTRVGDSTVYYSYREDEPGMPLIINLHGGGFIRARTESDDLFCRKLAYRLNCKVLDVDYRVAPEHPFPTALHECYDVVKWVYDNAVKLQADSSKIVLMGHSAGGNMVTGISMLGKQSGDFKAACVVMDYPPMDLFTDPDQKETRRNGIPAERARLYNLYYCEREQQQDYLVSPIFATVEQLRDFPNALVITAEDDSLCTEGEQFALRLAQAGSEVTLKRFPGTGHGFTIYRMNGHEDALDLIVRFVKSNLDI